MRICAKRSFQLASFKFTSSVFQSIANIILQVCSNELLNAILHCNHHLVVCSVFKVSNYLMLLDVSLFDVPMIDL